MNIDIRENARAMGQQAANDGADIVRRVLAERDEANIILATGASQFEMLETLTGLPDIDWSRVTGFHLDEYIGMPITHPASFRGYLKQRFVDQVPIKAFHYIDGEAAPQPECDRLGALIRQHPIDIAFIGIGENAHIAFNDPPADFETEQPYIVVELDEACRRQQLGEGWFPTLDDVPRQAISMSVRQILKSNHLIVSVPDERKAEAVRNAIEGELTPNVPASILRENPNVTLYLDEAAASKLSP
ncbi:MAG: glucosamine-6-phosphate deaminase [Verrucomicrobiota bacterium]